MNSKPRFTKTQIRALNAEQCTEELRSLNLDLSGGLGQKRDRLREALYPNSNLSQATSQVPSSQVQTAVFHSSQPPNPSSTQS